MPNLNFAVMFSNLRQPLVLFIASFVLLFISMQIKVMRWPAGNLLFGSMLMVQGIAIVWLIIAIFRKK